MKKTEEKILGFISKFGLIRNGESLLVGFSGGPDSVFCLHFLNKYRRKFRIDIGAVHVNHNIRKTSLNDVEFCREFCSERNIKFFNESVDVLDFAKKSKLSAEEAGRELRYEIFEKTAKQNLFDKIITAHNLDDNAETVLLNLIKGSGYNGLMGIPVQRNNIIRPVLCLQKSDIVDYLEKAKIGYLIDETNASNEYQRNYLRNEIIPKFKEKLNPNFSEAAFSLSENLRNLNEYIEKQVDKFIGHKVQLTEDGFSLNLKSINLIHPFLLSEGIRHLYLNKLKIGFQKNDFEKLQNLIQNQKGKKDSLRKKWIAIRESDSILFKKHDLENQKNTAVTILVDDSAKSKISVSLVEADCVEFVKNGSTEFIDAEKIRGKLIIRKWEAGDKFMPIGMKHHKLVSDFVTDLKLSAVEKKNVFVLVNRNNIVWVVGLRISERYKITSKTKKFLRLSVNDNRK